MPRISKNGTTNSQITNQSTSTDNETQMENVTTIDISPEVTELLGEKTVPNSPPVKTVSIYEELARIQREINVPKNQRNKFANYNFRNLEDIMEGYRKVKGDTCLVMRDEIEIINEQIYLKAVSTLFTTTGESISTVAYARIAEEKKGMDVSQITGMASSYARKYNLNGLFALDDNKDADTNEYHETMQAIEKQNGNGGKPTWFDATLKGLKECKTFDEMKGKWLELPSNYKTKELEEAKNALKKERGWT